MPPDVLVVEDTMILAEQASDSVLQEQVELIEVVAVAEQGPPGPPGETIVSADGALLEVNRLGEFKGNSAAQLEAQSNIGLGVEDPLAYYILAKS